MRIEDLWMLLTSCSDDLRAASSSYVTAIISSMSFYFSWEVIWFLILILEDFKSFSGSFLIAYG